MTYAKLDDELWEAASALDKAGLLPFGRRRRRKVLHVAANVWYEGIDKNTWRELTREAYKEEFGSITLVFLVIEIVLKLLMYWLMNRSNRERFLELRGEKC